MSLKSCATIFQTSSVAVVTGFFLLGCNSNAWMGDPSAQGYYKPTPTTIPILDRIDIIEEPDVWPRLSKVTPMDLMPSDLTYRIHPADVLDLKIFGLYQTNQHYPVTRRVDIGGHFRVPEVGNVLVAGLTVQGAQDLITSELGKKVLTHPSAQLEVIDQTALTYTVYGGLSRWGLFTLHNPDLRLVDVLALAGGVPQSTQEIYVIRQLEVSDTVLPSWDHSNAAKNHATPLNSKTPTTVPVSKPHQPSVDIEDLIKQLDLGEGAPSDTQIPAPAQDETQIPAPAQDETQIPAPAQDEIQTENDADINALINQLDISDTNEQPPHSVSPGIIQTGNHELIDIDDLVPARNSAPGFTPQQLLVDIDDLITPSIKPTTDSAFIYVPESDTWIPVSTGSKKATRFDNTNTKDQNAQASVVLERIIEIPWGLLKQGDSRYNIVIRPKDRVYVKGVPLGNLYIRGEISRPGVYDYPRSGKKITLSEFITSAGDLGPIAVPEKVSLTRRFGDVQATVTLNYAAILQRTEPDIFLKPNDHISIGTSWGATPMAIIRNGFRATYGFGFLLDRNFGNDVFGRPP